ncbi:hypothetical protein N7474_010778 [Penicillium riverlandense]|uniref:uncharacterized protein n=1 Tax=Penicillium riverlandense TaxID=1903569 RepID=UPI0025474803|nr:uncharacterized protein N7474_010778 [Penicillium riverlandense]KAJ5804891.1 hypothetical protein N7474_010778 [Penicillium riverlandense]
MPDGGLGHGPHGDVTIDIPLNDSPRLTQTGSRSKGQSSPEYVDEKSGAVAKHRGLPGRRRKTQDEINESTGKPSDSPEDGTINSIGRFYQAILNYSIVTRYLLYITPIGILIAIPIIVGATAARDAKIGGVHIYWFFAWIEVVWVSLWTSKVFARFLPYVFQSLCGIVSSGTRKYALILRALETPITIVLWCIISLVTFLPQDSGDTDVQSWEKSVKNILFALLVCSLIYFGEKAIVQLISISYHRKQFDAKIKQSKRNVYLVGLLYEASRNMFPVYCPEFADEDSLIFDSLLALNGTQPSKTGSDIMPFRMMRQVGQNVGRNVGRIGDKVTSAFGNVASELTGKQVFNPNSTHSVVVEALERKRCAEALARRIWMSFVVEGREALYLEDIIEVLGADQEAEAQECFTALDKDGNGDISLDEMVLTITEFGRMRKSLNNSMHDVDQAIHVLDNLLLGVAFVIGILVFVIAAGATSLLSISFIFSVTAQEVLGSCIFLFVKHPFDIGDRVDITDKSYVVERISLLYTVLRSITDHRTTQVPNNILNNLWIDNFTRANAMYEQLTVSVSFDTTFADIQFLREEMERFVRDKDNSRDFQQDLNVEVVGVGDMDKLELRVDIRHKSNWSNETVRAARRSKFMCALVLAIRKIPIRAPGAAAPEEEKKDDDSSDAGSTAGDDRKSTAQNGGADRQDGSGQMGLTAAAATAGGMASYDTAQSSGVDNGRSTGTVTQRGAANHSQSEAAIVEQLNARSPAADIARDTRDINEEAGLYRTTTGSSSQARQQLGVQSHGAGAPSREPSTGRRKEGTRASVPDQDNIHPPAPLSPVHAGLTPSSSSEVPILSAPAPPGSRGNARYEPQPQVPPHMAFSKAPASEAFTSPSSLYSRGAYSNPAYYTRENAYDPIPMSGISTHNNNQGYAPPSSDRDRRSGSGPPVSALEPSQYEVPSQRDAVSPPSLRESPSAPAIPVAAAAPGGGVPYHYQSQYQAHVEGQPLDQEQEHKRSSFLTKALKRSTKSSHE